jgi:hypothetical protein
LGLGDAAGVRLVVVTAEGRITVDACEVGAPALAAVRVELGLFDYVVANFAGDCIVVSVGRALSLSVFCGKAIEGD